jgi:hypothetical protein
VSAFNSFFLYFSRRFLNGGTVLAVMGAGWLYLWLVPWYESYVANPHWGHNYAQATAFLVLGLAYFNRRFVSDVLGISAALLTIPSALELAPHPLTASVGGGLLLLAILDMVVERRRNHDLWQPSNQRLSFWLKKHLPRFSYLMLAHIALTYFLVRLPSGTYETDLVTKVFDGMLVVLVVLLLMEDMAGIVNSVIAKRAVFFWGMLTTLVSLGLLANQPETYPVLAISILITLLGVAALRARPSTQEGVLPPPQDAPTTR